MKISGLVVPTLLFVCSLTMAQIVPPANFAKATLFASNGTQSDALAVADLDGDHKLDLVIGNSTSVSVLLGNGDGTFQSAVTYAGGAAENSLFLADMDGNGTLDIVAATPTEVSVFFGNGNGTFKPAIVTNVAGNALAVADVNHDGIQDVVRTTSSGIITLLGKGDGTFNAPVSTAAVASSVLAVADLNHDGKPDAVIVTYSGLITNKQRIRATVGLLHGNGDGTFQSPVNYDTRGFYPQQITIADLNGDGWQDILIVNYLGMVNNFEGSVGVWFGDRFGNFGRTSVINPSGHAAASVAVGDVNGDGVPDVVVNQFGSLTVVLTGGQLRNHGVYALLSGVAIADINGDGQPDLIAASQCLSLTDCSTGAAAVLMSAKVPSVTVLSSSSNPSQFGQAVTFTATVSSVRGPVPDGVEVTFLRGNAILGIGITAAGSATFTTSSLPVGTNSIKASFPGCVFVKPGTGRFQQLVNP